MAKYVNLLHANNVLLMEKNYYLLVIESRLQSMFPGLKYSLRLIRKIKYPLSWNFWTSKPSIPSPLVTSLLWSHSEWKTVLGTVKMNIKNETADKLQTISIVLVFVFLTSCREVGISNVFVPLLFGLRLPTNKNLHAACLSFWLFYDMYLLFTWFTRLH